MAQREAVFTDSIRRSYAELQDLVQLELRNVRKPRELTQTGDAVQWNWDLQVASEENGMGPASQQFHTLGQWQCAK